MFLDYLLNDEKFEAAAPRLRRGAGAYAPSFYAPYVLAAALCRTAAGRVVVAPDGEAATRLAADLSVYLDRAVPVLPARGVLYGADVAPAPHVVGERQQALAALAAGGVVVVEAVALLERFLPLELQPRPLTLAPGEELAFDGAVARLAELGYERVEQVRGRGEFAVRGGLIDAYPALGDPLRVEFWGDEVESVRTFSIYSQRTTGTLDEATVFAAFEADTSQPEYVTGLRQAVADWEREGREETPEELERRAAVRALAALAGRFTTLGDVAAAAGLGWAVFNPDETYRALADFDAEVATAVPGAALRERLYVPLAEARALLAEALHLDVVQRDQPLQFAASRPQFAARDIGSAERDLVRLVNDDYRVFVVFRHEGEAERATYRLRNLSAEVVTPEQLARRRRGGPRAVLRRRAAARGLRRRGPQARRRQRARADPRRAARAALRRRHAPHHLLRRAPRRLRGPRGPRHRPLRRHRDAHRRRRHPRLPAARVPRRGPRLRAARPDRQGQPLHRRLRRAPSLDKLGGTHWQTVKTRARTAVVEMAGELLQLYAARQAIPGLRLSARTGAACAASRRRSPTRRPTTRPRPSTRSRTTWRRRTRWTASSAATSATARPRSRCARPSRRPRPASRRWCSCPPPSSPSSTG